MKARIIITQIITQTPTCFECDLKIIVSEYRFDTIGSIRLRIEQSQPDYFSLNDINEIEKEIPEDKLVKFLDDIKEFISIKHKLCQVGKFKFTENFEFLIKDI